MQQKIMVFDTDRVMLMELGKIMEIPEALYQKLALSLADRYRQATEVERLIEQNHDLLQANQALVTRNHELTLVISKAEAPASVTA